MTINVVAVGYGGPEHLRVEQAEPSAISEGTIRIGVRAAAVNPFDVKVYSGAFGKDPSKLPMPIGSEASGVVLEASSDNPSGPTGPIRVGDEVIVFRATGAYASELLVPSSAVLHKPTTLTFEEASGLLLTGVTAAHLLHATNVTAGDVVLVHGAAGGVGQAVLQLVKDAGATAIGTASTGQHDSLKALGAIPVAYGDGLVDRVREHTERVDVALDLVGNDEAMDVSLELVADRSRIATIANFSRGPSEGVKVLGAGGDAGTEFRDAARARLVELAGAGRLRVEVEKTFPLDQAADAHRYLLSNHLHGKLVLIP